MTFNKETCKNLEKITFRAAMLIILLLFPVRTFAQPADSSKEDWRTLLNHLTGNWELSGQMGNQALFQDCTAEWILNHAFLQMHCAAVAPDSTEYQAKYIIGFDAESRKYVFHLFDIYGGTYSQTIGHGEPAGNSIIFHFEYPKSALRNTFTCHKKRQSWDMKLEQVNKEGKWELFAEKTLIKKQ